MANYFMISLIHFHEPEGVKIIPEIKISTFHSDECNK